MSVRRGFDWARLTRHQDFDNGLNTRRRPVLRVCQGEGSQRTDRHVLRLSVERRTSLSLRKRRFGGSMEPLLTLEDLAVLLKRSIATLRSDRSRAPHLLPPAVLIGRSPRYRHVDVVAWIAALPHEPPHALPRK